MDDIKLVYMWVSHKVTSQSKPSKTIRMQVNHISSNSCKGYMGSGYKLEITKAAATKQPRNIR